MSEKADWSNLTAFGTILGIFIVIGMIITVVNEHDAATKRYQLCLDARSDQLRPTDEPRRICIDHVCYSEDRLVRAPVYSELECRELLK